MNIRHLHHAYTKIRSLRAVYLLMVSAIFLCIGIYGLRQNNFTMIKLRTAVVEADKSNGDVETALHELRSFVHSHMNTNLSSGEFAIKPPIQLKARYERLATGEQQRVQALNAQVAAQAESTCGQQFPAGGFNSPRVSCIQDYVSRNAASDQGIPSELYKFDFLSPRWSPDLAGISLLLSAIFFFLFAMRVAVAVWMKKRFD